MNFPTNKLSANFLENTAIAVISLLAGLLLSKLLDKYIEYFSLLLVFSLAILIIYYKSVQRVNEITKVLSHIYGKCQGEIQYYDDPATFYEAGEKMILSATKEILIYNDYFGQDKIIMGYNTPSKYFNRLEKKIKILSANKEFYMSCIVGCDSISGAELSDNFKKHLENLFNIVNDKKVLARILPLAYADKRTLYLSFTIVDAIILRIAIEGIYLGNDGPSSRVIGGFIIKDNEEIVAHFRSLYLYMEKQSYSFSSIEEINQVSSNNR